MQSSPSTILFQGDSITDGGRSRNEDLNHVLGHGYAYLISSRLGMDLANRRKTFYNRGISGDRASDLYARWNEDAISLKPDLISILIGVNDAWRSMNGEAKGYTDRFGRAYRHLLEETREVMPDTGLVLMEPFILKTGATVDQWPAWQERISEYQEQVQQLAEQYGAVYVPLQQSFNEALQQADASYWLWDGVHPTAAGHELIARQWLSVVQDSPLAVV
ncbi:lysophospholipase L1-like esterase [Paenibacillus sp. JGP012]|uniref:SGNH/GDSL hydrolase family protein n=1 Tax=Paenibacillus sp. JGP012 TaxID=2735914 RepID=UPI0016089354|nr:SGNH/GDSL hydrolase family protein [Paenibacillus sp. JGP012]MBB6024444.1 lysophospholipase L1-like esterase [Paenibacillus sp. JGP012]